MVSTVRPYILIPVVLLVVYIGFLGIWFHKNPKALPILEMPPVVPVQQYSPQYRNASRCYDCDECPYRRHPQHLHQSHGQPRMTPGF
jgi:hypothetical protein